MNSVEIEEDEQSKEYEYSLFSLEPLDEIETISIYVNKDNRVQQIKQSTLALDESNKISRAELDSFIQKNISETKIFYSKRKYDIVEDDNFLYLLFIKDFKFKGSISPFSVEKDKIKSLIQNENKISYIKMLEKNIVNDAKLSNDIKIY